MSEKELLDRIDELEKRFSELMGDLKAAVKEFDAFKEEARQAKEEEAAEKPVKSRGTYNKRLFRRNINEKFVIGEFVRTHDWFFGERRNGTLEGGCDELDFFAYLYMVAYDKGWFDEDTKERNRQTFAKFIREEAFPHLKLNFDKKTFYNRLNPIMKSYKDYMEGNIWITDGGGFRVRNFLRLNDMIEDP